MPAVYKTKAGLLVTADDFKRMDAILVSGDAQQFQRFNEQLAQNNALATDDALDLSIGFKRLTLAAAALGLGVAAIVFIPELGVIAMLTAAMSIAGSIPLGAAGLGSLVSKDWANTDFEAALDISASLPSLIGASVGGVISGSEKGLKTGAAIGGAVDLLISGKETYHAFEGDAEKAEKIIDAAQTTVSAYLTQKAFSENSEHQEQPSRSNGIAANPPDNNVLDDIVAKRLKEMAAFAEETNQKAQKALADSISQINTERNLFAAPPNPIWGDQNLIKSYTPQGDYEQRSGTNGFGILLPSSLGGSAFEINDFSCFEVTLPEQPATDDTVPASLPAFIP